MYTIHGMNRDFAAKKTGYCQPPIHTRWPKGTSGNPAGRPKGRRNRRTIRREIAAIFDFEHLAQDMDRGLAEALGALDELGL